MTETEDASVGMRRHAIVSGSRTDGDDGGGDGDDDVVVGGGGASASCPTPPPPWGSVGDTLGLKVKAMPRRRDPTMEAHTRDDGNGDGDGDAADEVSMDDEGVVWDIPRGLGNGPTQPTAATLAVMDAWTASDGRASRSDCSWDGSSREKEGMRMLGGGGEDVAAPPPPPPPTPPPCPPPTCPRTPSAPIERTNTPRDAAHTTQHAPPTRDARDTVARGAAPSWLVPSPSRLVPSPA